MEGKQMIVEVLEVVLAAIVTSLFTFSLGFTFGCLMREQVERAAKDGRR
jgi:hypothetical protein